MTILTISASAFLLELNYDRGNQHDFITLMKELARPGELTQNAVFRFEFPKVEKPYESYVGANVKLRLVFIIKVLCCKYANFGSTLI